MEKTSNDTQLKRHSGLTRKQQYITQHKTNPQLHLGKYGYKRYQNCATKEDD
jgi:hypothetical protein